MKSIDDADNSFSHIVTQDFDHDQVRAQKNNVDTASLKGENKSISQTQDMTKAVTNMEVTNYNSSRVQTNVIETTQSVNQEVFVDQTQKPTPAKLSRTELLLQLKNSIDTMSTRMDTFETTLTSKIDALENNYNELNSRIEVMS